MKNKGFTLIELLVVILIVAILSAVAVPQYFKVVERGRFTEASSCFGGLQGAQERFFLKNNTYTGVAANLDTNCTAGLRCFAAPVIGQAAGAWSANMTRGTVACPAPLIYTAYTVRYTVAAAGSPGVYTCTGGGSAAGCTNDLLP